MKSIASFFVSSLVLVIGNAYSADAAINPGTAVDERYLASQAIHVDGALAGAWRISDRNGEHVLVLSRKTEPSSNGNNTQSIENIDLAAKYYSRSQSQTWQQEWVIRDHSYCPGLDVAGDFFTANVTFSDLNNDGRTEVTVPYRLFCGGGIDPYVVKVILREGKTKLAIRGESLVRYPGQKAFGGEHQHDKALLTPERAIYKKHMDAVWREVSNDLRK